MDRCKFIGILSSSSGKSVEDCVLYHFNEIMLLYDLFGSCDNIKVSIGSNGDICPFNISFNNEKDAIKMVELTNGNIINIYNNKYIINSSSDKKAVKVIISLYHTGMG